MARKILLADDSVTAQNMGRKILTDAGYEVVTVNNGSTALKKITELKPDVVVLDVYMPGYSGLEVCQRIKEGNDTSHVPVLLTVGKLEPFKQEEARRARADAFIIKPFEATELLAAVGKLQDKIGVVPQPATTKESRFAAANMASFERAMAESAPKFGDEESGWKARLTIPASGSKAHEVEAEPAPPPHTAFRDLVEEKRPAEPSSTAFERPVPTGIPRDITPDEIAAITAAAARVNVGLSVGKDFARFQQDSSRVELPVVEPNQPEAEAESAEKFGSSAEPEKTAGKRAAAQADVPAAAAEGSSKSAPALEQRAVPASVSVVPAAVAVPEPATMAIGPRWVAEEIALDARESVLVLEREMHKAFAAFAAAEYAAMPADERGAVDKNDEPLFASMAPPAIGSPVPVPDSFDISERGERVSDPASAFSPSEVERIQDLPKPPAPSFAPAGPATSDDREHAVVAFGAPTPFEASESTAADEENPAAPTADPLSAVASAAQPSSDLQAAVSASEKPAKPAEQADESSQQICEAVLAKAAAEISSGNKTQAGDEAKPAKAADQDEPKREAAMAAAASSDGSSSTAELSNIVDNMLAELKPRLMAELAKKLEQKK